MTASYEAYRVFYHVATCESFTMAARILHNSQPNITRIMGQLEQELGCRLFIRSNKGITLTHEGEILFAHVQEAVQHIACAETELKNTAHLHNGQITVAASEAALRGVLLPALRSYRQDFPGVQINVRSMTSEEAIFQMQHNLADLAVVTKPLYESAALRIEALATFPDALVVPAAAALEPDAVYTLEQIADWPFIAMHRKSVSYEMLCGYFAAHGLLFHPTTFVSAMSQIVPMVCSGLGAAFLPEFMAAEQLRTGEILRIRLDDRPPSHTVCMISLANQPVSAACRELMNRLRKKKTEADDRSFGDKSRA